MNRGASQWGRRAFAAFLASALAGCDRSDEKSDQEERSAANEIASEARDWPLFRGDAEMQGVSLENLAPPLEIAWTFEPPAEEGRRRAPITASPVCGGGRVFFGGQDAKFYCLDLKTGAPQWTAEIEGPVSAPAALDEKHVYFGDNLGYIHALDWKTGAEVWKIEADDKIEGGVNLLDVPSSEGAEEPERRLYIGSHDFNLYCIRAVSGEVIWKHETENYIMATPSIEASLPAVIFGGCDGFVHFVSARDGASVHKIEAGQYVPNSAAVRDGIAYIAHYGGEVMAVEVASGETVWKTATGVEYHASPAVTDKLLIVAGTDKRVAAFDRVTGKEVWAFQASRAFEASPVISGGLVWVAGQDARLYALDLATGEEKWSFDLGAQVAASPAISAGTLVICGEDGRVYGFASGDAGKQP
ncbi:MAG: PQQ-binding-like beta-propeller repeat protein [Verrucomicrobiae bacterium]|nr:PQQ-binding-like beta-propeller repeat protein [Verrucomicrobiae bacterium]MCP5539694.1 PQQ-binding-like beta-propeller repeat protein [Akkermansiaceae bacterium]MCP5549434.1 PQQ-binding-like beta-propeller repeat protein [Akkermansiaceae bacterium]